MMLLIKSILPYLVYAALFAGCIFVVKDVVRRVRGL